MSEATQDTQEIPVDEIVGYSDFERDAAGEVTAVQHRRSGEAKRVNVRVSIEREHRRADGSLVAKGEVASTDDGSVRVGEGASL